MTNNDKASFNALTDQHIKNILQTSKTIAIVGLSDKPQRDSYHVGQYLQQQGYRIIPVNPGVDEILGEKSYARLEDIPEPVDLVDIFRKPDAVEDIVRSAIEIKAKTIWMQLGIVHQSAAQQARQAGLSVVMDQCILIEHRKHFLN